MADPAVPFRPVTQGLTRFHLHSSPVRVTLTLRISHLQMESVGPLDQVGKKEDGLVVGVVQHLLWG